MSQGYRLPTDIPLDEYPPPSAFVEEAIACVKDAQGQGATIRVMGGLAIFLHCQNSKGLWEKLGRLGGRVFTDIDFVGYGKHRQNIYRFFTKRGYSTDQTLLSHYGTKRQIYFGKTVPMIDVFFDELAMNHVINFKGRLESDDLTIPLADLLLQKLQIVQMNEKDIKDSIVLLREHKIGSGDAETINSDYISKLLSEDWGFYYTATTNLNKVNDSLPKYEVVTEEDRATIKESIAGLSKSIEGSPKSMKWKMRAKIGPSKRWYNDVADWGR